MIIMVLGLAIKSRGTLVKRTRFLELIRTLFNQYLEVKMLGARTKKASPVF